MPVSWKQIPENRMVASVLKRRISIVTALIAGKSFWDDQVTGDSALLGAFLGAAEAVKWRDCTNRRVKTQMSMGTQAVLAGQVEAAAKAAGLVVVSSEVGQDFSGNPTTRFMLALMADQSKTQVLELSDKFDFSRADMLAEVGTYLGEAAKRLKIRGRSAT